MPPLIRRNPAIGAFTYSRTKDRVETRTWSADEVQRFLSFTARDRDFALYRMALMTGMQRGEISGYAVGIWISSQLWTAICAPVFTFVNSGPRTGTPACAC